MRLKNTPNFDGKGLSIAIVTARYNEEITQELHDMTRDTLIKQGVTPEKIYEEWVPGSCELPIIAKKLASFQKFHAIVAIGVIIKGETAHFEYVASLTTDGLGKIPLDHMVPVIFGVLTTYNREQAKERSGPMRLGEAWALNAIEMARKMISFENL